MMYLHTPEYQEVLQAALKRRHLEETDEEIAWHSGLGKSGKMTVQQFRTAKLGGAAAVGAAPPAEAQPDNNGKSRIKPRPRTLKLDFPVAVQLWNYCHNEVAPITRQRPDLLYHTERLAANAMNAFYRVHESQTTKWEAEFGLQKHYYCYKPSVLLPGRVVKSSFHIDLMNNEYFEITEEQKAKYEQGWKSAERSTGFGFSKSEVLWCFLREESKEQPRIFCFTGRDTDDQGHITRLRGYVMENDRRYTDRLYIFKVGLVSLEHDIEIWKQENPGEEYNPAEQVDVVRFPRASPGRRADNRRVVLDRIMVEYIKSDSLKMEKQYVPEVQG